MDTTITTATKITILRILLIPVFALLVISYDSGHCDPSLQSIFHWAAIACFLVASISDGVDGYLARHCNQKSALGAVLDPIADKGLLVTSLLLLAWKPFDPEWKFPVWFPLVVLSRDLLLVLGYAIVHIFKNTVHVRPNWIGKTATVLQMTAIIMAMIRWPHHAIFGVAVIAAGTLTAISYIPYFLDGMKQLSAEPHAS